MRASDHVAISPLCRADAADWRRLWQAYQRFYQVSLSEAVHETTWARLHDPAEPIHGAMARTRDGTAVGLVHFILQRTCWDVADHCYLQDLYVDEAMRNTGIGAALIAHVAAAATRLGATRVHWHTHETNSRARILYDKIGRRTGFIQYVLEKAP